MKVLFNASVVLAGLRSETGASGVLLKLVREGKIRGIISELIFNETLRHSEKIGMDEERLGKEVVKIFNNNVFKLPQEEIVEKYYSFVSDRGDAHVLASYEQEDCDVLITLDKKHLLVLQGKIKGVKIVSPGEFLLARSKAK